MYCLETAQPRWQSLPTSKPIRSTAPTEQQEPLTLDEAKHQCGIASGISHHDDYLRALITAAREKVERDTGLVCYTGTHVWKLTYFPANDWLEMPVDARPVTSVTSITYVDYAGTTQTWSGANYSLDASGVVSFIKLTYGQSWPVVRGDINGITVTYVAGYSSVLNVPKMLKQAALYLVNHWFANRDTVSLGTISPDISMTYEALIMGLAREGYP